MLEMISFLWLIFKVLIGLVGALIVAVIVIMDIEIYYEMNEQDRQKKGNKKDEKN